MQFDPSRRLFLRNAGVASLAPIVIPPTIGPIEKIVKYFFAPIGGWAGTGTNQFLTINYLTQETLRILRANLRFHNALAFDRKWKSDFAIGSTVQIRMPQIYKPIPNISAL